MQMEANLTCSLPVVMGGQNCREFYTMFSDGLYNLLKAQKGQTEAVLTLLFE